ncbi:hypothetical protein ORI20_21505 [Mycobacterium sp. CVI_P3]|uniref:Secreted protein n=1 Tax=Mycobacterium pinniadriaticum TaxID=2994102 RepID=A0ABT3SIJ5_9MYCO|nr:hypothetical protein [Mycobacterium pinniadriaticum]MCX2932854.1 hypothetical protein [Mycobacterium pinniadriaticum]MCX2939278.1 hypothetical protein [Mycobacterium pinniadriaticum]
MRHCAVLAATASVAAAFSLVAVPAHADNPVPAAGAPCLSAFANAMTQLPGGRDFLVCQADQDRPGRWAPVDTPFDPADTWLSYGPAITLHGQGFRNPNLRSGQWTAKPLAPDTVCGADQVTVVSAGVLAPLVHSEGPPGEQLQLEVLPKLFTITLSGDCLWTEDQPPGVGW